MLTDSAIKCAVPGTECLTTNILHFIASIVFIISMIDSPLDVDELAISIFIKSDDIFFVANSKVVLVLVLGSKKRLATTLPVYLIILELS